MKQFDIGILEGNKVNPMHVVIHQRTGEWMTHCVVCKDDFGNIWDASLGGIADNNLRDYPGRKVTILRYKQWVNEIKLYDWIIRTQSECLGYDYAALIGFLTGLQSFQDDRRWFCSELGYWLFQANGYPLTRKDRTFIYPADLYYNNEFDLIEEYTMIGLPKPDPEFPETSIPG